MGEGGVAERGTVANTTEIYQREDGLWDWRIVAGNGEIVATSGGQGFTERNDAREAVIRVLADQESDE